MRPGVEVRGPSNDLDAGEETTPTLLEGGDLGLHTSWSSVGMNLSMGAPGWGSFPVAAYSKKSYNPIVGGAKMNGSRLAAPFVRPSALRPLAASPGSCSPSGTRSMPLLPPVGTPSRARVSESHDRVRAPG